PWRHEACRLEPRVLVGWRGRVVWRERPLVGGDRVGVQDVIEVHAYGEAPAREPDVLRELQIEQRDALAVELVVQQERHVYRGRISRRSEASDAVGRHRTRLGRASGALGVPEDLILAVGHAR